jgi:hypothetical protein
MSIRSLRIRAFLGRWFEPLLAVLLVLAAVGAYGAYTAHVAPGTTTEEREVGQLSVDSGFAHSATVTRENPVFAVGSELRNRSTYFVGVSPVLDGDYTTSYRAGTARNVTLALDGALVLEATGENGESYWSVTEPLGERRATDVAPGETVRLPFSVNASAVSARLSEIDEQLGGTPGETSVAVVVDVRLTGTIDGEPTNLEFTRPLTFSLDGSTYGVTPPADPVATPRRTETVTVQQEYGPLYTAGAPVLLVLALASLGAMGYARREDRLTLDEDERAYLDYVDDRREFSEWLARIELPAAAFDRPRAEAQSLADLVDFAIDADTGVVESPSGDSFYVVGEEYLFVYEPPAEPRDVDGEQTGGSDGTADAGGASAEAGSSDGTDGTDNGDGGPETDDGATAVTGSSDLFAADSEQRVEDGETAGRDS